MKTATRRLSVITGFLVLLLILIANAVIARRQLRVQESSQVWVNQTQQVLIELRRTESLLIDAEAGQRGFLYTGDLKYLAPYDLALSELTSHLGRLEQLTGDNPVQLVKTKTLRELSVTKLREMADTITLYRSGDLAGAKAVVLSSRGIDQMDSIRTLVDSMEADEVEIESSRAATHLASVETTILSTYFSNAIAMLALVILGYFILRESRLRERHVRLLEDREDWFRMTLTSLGDAVIATDQHGKVTFLNAVAERLIGTTNAQAHGHPIADVFPIFNEATYKPVENPVVKVIAEGRIVGLANHTVLRDRDGNMIPIEDSAAPLRDADGKLVGVVLVFRDASLERQTQEVLRKTEKLAAAARLSATIAHEINNPLEAIGNLIYLAKGEEGISATAREHLRMAEDELERVSHITRQTLGFYRESKLPELIDMPELVESVLRIHSNKFMTKNIAVLKNFQECPPIHGLAGELKQVMANLISNAADAVAIGGTIWVGLECIETRDGRSVQVTVEDDGPGITEKNRARIFEPFFTTKKDVGTGLGLWVSREIVDRHGGTITMSSRRGVGASGSVFHVHLPLAVLAAI